MLQVFAAEFLQNDISYVLYRPSKRQAWIRFRVIHFQGSSIFEKKKFFLLSIFTDWQHTSFADAISCCVDGSQFDGSKSCVFGWAVHESGYRRAGNRKNPSIGTAKGDFRAQILRKCDAVTGWSGQTIKLWIVQQQVAGTIEEKLVRMDDNKKMSSFVDGNMTVQDLLDLMSLQGSSQLQKFSGSSLSNSMRF